MGYRWSVRERPEGSTSRFVPNDGSRDATLFLDLAGRYALDLDVTSGTGERNSEPCRVVIEACCRTDWIHVQLVWDTPADPDQTDTGPGAGADLDLHLLRGPGRWGCPPDDVWGAHPEADWGIPDDASDDPHLDFDDVDGAGPEDVNLHWPEDGTTYHVGVHYVDDHGFGTSFATVRVFLRGVLSYEAASRRLDRAGQLWEVASISRPDDEITPVDRIANVELPESECPGP